MVCGKALVRSANHDLFRGLRRVSTILYGLYSGLGLGKWIMVGSRLRWSFGVILDRSWRKDCSGQA